MKLLLPLSIFVTKLTAATLPVNKIPVDGKPSVPVPVSVPSNPSMLAHAPTTEAALPDSIPGVFHEMNASTVPAPAALTVTLEYAGTATATTTTVLNIPWDDEYKPNNIDSGDNDNDNGDVAKRDGFWDIGDDDKIFREMMDDIHHWAKAKPSTAKRKPQSDEDMEDSVPTFCNIPGECIAYGPVPPPEKRDTNKDVNCHNDEQCSPGICQDGICLLK